MRTLLLVWGLLAAGAWGESLAAETAGVSPSSADNTAALQSVLDRAGALGGGKVTLGPGVFRFRGSLTVPAGVTLAGSAGSVPSHPSAGPAVPAGTRLEVFGGRGEANGTPFVTVGGNATLQGVCISYPEQTADLAEPLPYPWAVALKGNNPALLDCELLNPYQGIDASLNQRATIRNVHGQPLRTGLFVDEVYDVGRIENVHWNPWWSLDSPAYRWQRLHGTGFAFGRTDWHSVLNTFCFGYSVGYRFFESPHGVCNGSFVGIGADACHTCVQVDQSAPFGLLISGGQFVALEGEDPVQVRVAPSNTGVVRFVNSAFWGKSRACARVAGEGTVGFSDCTFLGAAIGVEASSGTLLLRGCEFRDAGRALRLGSRVRGVVSDNVARGGLGTEEREGLRVHDNLER